jgi:hypothetical protein
MLWPTKPQAPRAFFFRQTYDNPYGRRTSRAFIRKLFGFGFVPTQMGCQRAERTWDVMHLKRGRNARCDGAMTPSRPEWTGVFPPAATSTAAIPNVWFTSTPTRLLPRLLGAISISQRRGGRFKTIQTRRDRRARTRRGKRCASIARPRGR